MTGLTLELGRTIGWASPQAQEVLAVSASESSASLAGRVVADIVTIGLGVSEVAAGIGIGTGGTAVACGTTLCIGAVATIGTAAVATAQGATTALAGSAGLGNNLAKLAGKNASGKLFGENGTQFTSKSFWEGEQGHLDAENPAPGERPGQIHFQSGNYKWYYDSKTNTFPPDKQSGTPPPGYLKKLLEKDEFQNALDRAFYYLGEER